MVDKEDNNQEIEVTDEMIKAGLEENLNWTCEEERAPSDDWKLRNVFLAMYAARSDKDL